MLAAATMLAAALVPVPLAPASRAAAVVRASRPVMLVEAAETVVQSGLLVDSVVDMPLMALSDSSLVDSVQALPHSQPRALRHTSLLTSSHTSQETPQSLPVTKT